MSSPGATELLIVLVIVLLILGPKRLPALGRQLGGGIREFRKSIGGDDETPGSDATEIDARTSGGGGSPDRSGDTADRAGETADRQGAPGRRAR